jgi:hypothetical protein
MSMTLWSTCSLATLHRFFIEVVVYDLSLTKYEGFTLDISIILTPTSAHLLHSHHRHPKPAAPLFPSQNTDDQSIDWSQTQGESIFVLWCLVQSKWGGDAVGFD